MIGDNLSKGTSMEGTHHEGTTEVVARPVRRRHTVAYKLKVLETVAALRAEGNGAVGAYLRREGLYYSSVQFWHWLKDGIPQMAILSRPLHEKRSQTSEEEATASQGFSLKPQGSYQDSCTVSPRRYVQVLCLPSQPHLQSSFPP